MADTKKVADTKIQVEPSFSSCTKKVALLHFDKPGSKSEKQLMSWKNDLCIIKPTMVLTVMSAYTLREYGGKGEADMIIVLAEEHTIHIDEVMNNVKALMTVPSNSAVFIYVTTEDVVAINYGKLPKTQVVAASDFKDFTSWWPQAVRFLYPPTTEQQKAVSAGKSECIFLYDEECEKDVKWYNRNRKALQQFGVTCIWPGIPTYKDGGVPITAKSVVVALLNDGGEKVKEKHGTIIDEASKLKAKILLVAEFTEDLAPMEDIAVRLYKKHHKLRLVFDMMKQLNLITIECAMGKRIKSTFEKCKGALIITGFILLVILCLGLIVGMVIAKMCMGYDCTQKFPVLKCFKFFLLVGKSKSRKIKPFVKHFEKIESKMGDAGLDEQDLQVED